MSSLKDWLNANPWRIAFVPAGVLLAVMTLPFIIYAICTGMWAELLFCSLVVVAILITAALALCASVAFFEWLDS